ncbi:hypothetical protein ACH5RR_001055 [Cinchona calisaya]|uniref:Uncharacterized protein n=1 Tax=Cinchona calisaya TaxID=153742 RepID=A0ABD3B2G0_9GENT
MQKSGDGYELSGHKHTRGSVAQYLEHYKETPQGRNEYKEQIPIHYNLPYESDYKAKANSFKEANNREKGYQANVIKA